MAIELAVRKSSNKMTKRDVMQVLQGKWSGVSGESDVGHNNIIYIDEMGCGQIELNLIELDPHHFDLI